MNNPGYKMIDIGKIPEEWEVVKLGSIVNPVKGKKPNELLEEAKDGTLPYLTAEMMRTGIVGQWARDGIAVQENDVLLIWDGSYSGDVFIGFKGILASTMVKLEPKISNLDTIFLYNFLKTKFHIFNSTTTGTAVPHVSKSVFTNLSVPLPSLPEQQKIASILSTVDEAIQKTNEVIAKTERLKKGLMQELLTKGIGHKEFKDTEIGRIPKEWDVVRLKDVLLEAKSGFACGNRDENGILQLRMDSIETEGWINTGAGVKVPIPENVENYILKPGDILFNNTNSVDLIGKTAIFKGEFPRCVYSNHLTRIRINLTEVIPEWILYLLIRKWQLGVFRTICHRHVHQAGINNRDILNLKIPLPPLSEQQKIAEVLSAVDDKIEKEKQRKEQLEKLKKGLMQDLLTGRVRVKVN